MTLYMFRTVFPSIIRSSRLYIQQQAFKCLLLYVQSWTPCDGRKNRPKHVECHSKIKSTRYIVASSWIYYRKKKKTFVGRRIKCLQFLPVFNPLTLNDHYSGRTAPLTSKRCILYIYSTNTGTEYFKQGIYSPSFSLQNAVCFIILTYLVPVLFTFYIHGVLKFKKIIQAPKG